MKYIKLYEDMKNQQYDKSTLDGMINKNLIEDLFDTSIDLIDDGYTLVVNIFTNGERCGKIEKSHSDTNYKYYDDAVKSHDISYSFCYILDKNTAGKISKRCGDILEILEIMKERYPKERMRLYGYLQTMVKKYKYDIKHVNEEFFKGKKDDSIPS